MFITINLRCALIRPILGYGTEASVVNSEEMQVLRVLQRNIKENGWSQKGRRKQENKNK